VALLATFLTLLVLLGAVLDLVVSTATAIAQLTLGAICHSVVRLTAIEATLLAGLTGLLLTLRLLLTLAFALALAFVIIFTLTLAFALGPDCHGFHGLPIVIDLPCLELLPVVVVDLIPGVGLAILGIDALLFGHCESAFCPETTLQTQLA